MTASKRAFRSLILLLPLAAACGTRDAPADRQSVALDSITGERIRSHMVVLAADSMEGREAGTPGYDRAASYVAEAFSQIGLEPPEAGGSYLQPIDFLETRLEAGSATATLHRSGRDVQLAFADDFVRWGGYGEAEESVTAPLVFVGHGITAPGYGHDDFAGLTVEGKILVALSGAPPRFETDQRAFYSSSAGKRALAAERGAVGLLTIRTPVDQERNPWARLLSGINSPDMRWLDKDGLAFESFPRLQAVATLSESGARKLFELAGRDLKQTFEHHEAGGIGSFDMAVSATLAHRSETRIVSSPNVVGLLPGSDPDLGDQYIVYTAHLDHLGIQPDESGDTIHNGAYDNAAGIAAILEIARGLAQLDPAPRRSILFTAVTAEEKGLQGSSYFARQPPVPADRLVANINIDMPYLGYPIADVHAFGAEHSSLSKAVARATAELGLKLTPDPRPELVRFVRSDQFSFVKEGIPALALKPGTASRDPSVDGEAMLADFLHSHYHRPSDDLDLPFSDEGAEALVRTALLVGLLVAEDDAPPRWNEGDFFGDRFAP